MKLLKIFYSRRHPTEALSHIVFTFNIVTQDFFDIYGRVGTKWLRLHTFVNLRFLLFVKFGNGTVQHFWDKVAVISNKEKKIP